MGQHDTIRPLLRGRPVKGFPNQVADLRKLATAMQCIVRLVDTDGQARDDGILGQELVRASVAGTGHRPAGRRLHPQATP